MHPRLAWAPPRILFLLFCSCLLGCGSGIAAIVASSGGGGSGGGNFSAAVGSVQISDTDASPALVEFLIIDPESDPVDVELLFSEPGSSILQHMRLLACPDENIDTNQSGLATSPDGVLHRKLWDFSPVGEEYREGYEVRVRIQGNAGGGQPAGEVIQVVNLGNDPPEVA